MLVDRGDGRCEPFSLFLFLFLVIFWGGGWGGWITTDNQGSHSQHTRAHFIDFHHQKHAPQQGGGGAALGRELEGFAATVVVFVLRVAAAAGVVVIRGGGGGGGRGEQVICLLGGVTHALDASPCVCVCGVCAGERGEGMRITF